jgi:hypothetical protein
MSSIDLKEKLENNSCHIHQQKPVMSLQENGKLKLKTCCILFKNQLNLLVDEQDQKHIDD